MSVLCSVESVHSSHDCTRLSPHNNYFHLQMDRPHLTSLYSFSLCVLFHVCLYKSLVISPVRDSGEFFSEWVTNCVTLLFFFCRTHEKGCLVKESSSNSCCIYPTYLFWPSLTILPMFLSVCVPLPHNADDSGWEENEWCMEQKTHHNSIFLWKKGITKIAFTVPLACLFNNCLIDMNTSGTCIFNVSTAFVSVQICVCVWLCLCLLIGICVFV